MSDLVQSARTSLLIAKRTVEETFVGLGPGWLLRECAVGQLWLGISSRDLPPWRVVVPRIHR